MVLGYTAGCAVPFSVQGSDEYTYDKEIQSLIDERLSQDENAKENGGEGTLQNISENTLKKADISDFRDVNSDDWFYPYLSYLVSEGTVNGKTSDSFEPNGTFSYAECAAVIVRYLGLSDEAETRRKKIVSRMPETKNLWYVGYFELLGNLGLFENFGVFQMTGGLLTGVDKAKADSPVKRCEFAKSISQSFELSSDICAENVFSEVGGAGREFIVTGGYREDILEKYEDCISDYQDIPEDLRIYVLKAYYNGIFNGDELGKFNPNESVTRAEMAKVLATVCDFSQRRALLEDEYITRLDENMFHTDYADNKTVKYSVWRELLENESQNLSVLGDIVSYTSSLSAPIGYAFDVYLYEKDGETYKKCAECTLHDFSDGSFVYRTQKDVKVLFVLRNLSMGARSEGSFEVLIHDGYKTMSYPKIREIPNTY